MAQDYSIVLDTNNRAYKKYYQTYIVNEDDIPTATTRNVLGNTCKITQEKIDEYNDNVGPVKIHREYSKLVQDILISEDDQNAKNNENISNSESTSNTENILIIPNVYNTFRDIHYYFTQFCYKIKGGIYEDFLESVERYNRAYGSVDGASVERENRNKYRKNK